MKKFIISFLLLTITHSLIISANYPIFTYHANKTETIGGTIINAKILKVMFYPRINTQSELIMFNLCSDLSGNDVKKVSWFKKGQSSYNYVISYDDGKPYYTLYLNSHDNSPFTLIIGYSDATGKGFVEFLENNEEESTVCYFDAKTAMSIFNTVARQVEALSFRKEAGSLYIDRNF